MRTLPKLSPKPNSAGKYEIRWSEQRGETWRSKRRSTGTGDYAEAVKKLSEFMTIREVVEQGGRSMTVAEVADQYLRHHSQPRGNRISDERALRAPLEAFGSFVPKSISDQDIETYARARQNGRYGAQKVRPGTVRRELVALQAVLNYGVRRGLIRSARDFKLPKPSDGPPRVLWINEAQQEEIVSHMKDASLDVQMFIRLGLTYGVRKGAMMDLRFGPQVDFIANTIDFNVPGKRQTRKRRPVVPMTKSVRANMAQLFEAKGRDWNVLNRSTPSEYERFMTSIGYGWVTPHVLKHSAISLMLRAGVQPGDVSRLTATDLRTIYKVYRHHTVDELAVIAEGRGL